MWEDSLHWLDEHGGAVSAVGTVVAAFVAIAALVSAALDSRSRSEPMVLAELRRAPDADSSMELVVRNAGPTVARDIRVEFDPPLVIPEDVDPARVGTSYTMRRYSKPIPMLAPGQELVNTWFLGAARGGEIENVEPTPEHASVKVSYRGRRWRRHRDEYVLDVSVIKEDTSITSSSSFKGRLKSIDESLKSISRGLSKR